VGNARKIFAFMVPITLISFLIGVLTLGSHTILTDNQVFDWIGLVVVGSGVFMFNWYDEKPQKASIENIQFSLSD
jgi:hypothetical protein